MTPSREQVIDALRDVFDPELGMSVIDLGLIYDVRIDGGRVAVTMTLTSAGCPLHDAMTDWVRRAVEQVPDVDGVAVTLTFDPPWTPERMDSL
jgi:metal-sulfur cluster biosynthetic enzyme